MNHIYRLIWSHITNAWVAVAENVKGRGKSSSGRKSRIVGAVALTGSVLVSGFALAAPTGGQITAGSGNITASGSNTTITKVARTSPSTASRSRAPMQATTPWASKRASRLTSAKKP
jgi:hypothetical protein